MADAVGEIGWGGDMRHLPTVGSLLTLGRTTPYLVVKQDNNGDTFVSTTDAHLYLDAVAAKATPRRIGVSVAALFTSANTGALAQGADQPADYGRRQLSAHS